MRKLRREEEERKEGRRGIAREKQRRWRETISKLK